MRRLAGTAAIALAIVHLLVGVVFFLLPPGQRGAGAAPLLASLAEDGTVGYLGWQWLFVLSGAFGLAVVGGVASALGPDRVAGARWASTFGYLGFGLTIVDALGSIAFVYQDAHRFYAEADDTLRTVIAGDLMAGSVAPQGWATFGLIGVWLVAVSLIAVRDRTLLHRPALLGVPVALGYWLVPLGAATGQEALIMLAAVLAIVLAPVLYLWAGVVLRRTGEDPTG